jgi:hypothetical protein
VVEQRDGTESLQPKRILLQSAKKALDRSVDLGLRIDNLLELVLAVESSY